MTNVKCECRFAGRDGGVQRAPTRAQLSQRDGLPAEPVMNDHVTATRSIRRRLIVRLLASAAILAVILFLVVQSFGRQLAQESQDNISTTF